MTSTDPDFLTLYPGVLTAKEVDLVAQDRAANRALAERGPLDTAALAAGQLPPDTPGLRATLPVTEAMVRYNNGKYDPDNPLLHDREHARQAGFRDIPAFLTFGSHDDTFMLPHPFEARDTLLVSQLNHSVTALAPIHPGDTLHLVLDERSVTDCTPVEGSTYRSLWIENSGSVYNQDGVKVSSVVFRVMESVRIYREGRRPAEMDFRAAWEAPDWTGRPVHTYTDEDWDLIRDVWRKETRRGDEPLHWEDVRVGDRPTWTADGPIDASVLPTDPYGMGTGGSRSLRAEILDDATFATMVRGTDGIYRLPDQRAHIPAVPDGAVSPLAEAFGQGEIDTRDIHSGERQVLINFLGRDIAVRHLNNWMGEHGLLRNIRWGIMPVGCMAAHGKDVPRGPSAPSYLAVVPGMEGREATVHGVSGDLALVKSYVYDTYVRDGAFLVELAWWIENIDGEIWEAGGATVELPSRGEQRTDAA